MKGSENLILHFGAAGRSCYHCRATGRRQFADRTRNNEDCTACITTVNHKAWKCNLRAVLAAIASLFLLTLSVRLPDLLNPSSTLFIKREFLSGDSNDLVLLFE